MLRMRTIADTVIPAALVSRIEKFLATATAAIAFIGWTGSGRPKNTPVAMFARPAKMRVLASEIERVSVSAIMRGSSVPRSPIAQKEVVF